MFILLFLGFLSSQVPIGWALSIAAVTTVSFNYSQFEIGKRFDFLLCSFFLIWELTISKELFVLVSCRIGRAGRSLSQGGLLIFVFIWWFYLWSEAAFFYFIIFFLLLQLEYIYVSGALPKKVSLI